MVHLLKMVIFHGYVSHNQMVPQTRHTPKHSQLVAMLAVPHFTSILMHTVCVVPVLLRGDRLTLSCLKS